MGRPLVSRLHWPMTAFVSPRYRDVPLKVSALPLVPAPSKGLPTVFSLLPKDQSVTVLSAFVESRDQYETKPLVKSARAVVRAKRSNGTENRRGSLFIVVIELNVSP